MSPNDRTNKQHRLVDRRRFLRGTGAVTAVGALGIGTVAAAPDEKRTPTPYPKKGPQGSSFESDAYFTHISELPGVKHQLNAYEKTGEPGHLFTHELARKLEEGTDGTVNVTVSTCGQRSEITSRGQFGRRLHGWRPTAEEVAELSKFGEVIRVPEVISTKVALSDVAVEDLPKIAALDFVLEIGFNPTITRQHWPEHDVSAQAKPTADDLKKASHSDFDSAIYDLTIYTQVGVIGDGYSGETWWDQNWAKTVGNDSDEEWNGIDDDLAKDFVGDGWWIGDSHATNSSDTVAYMLKEGDPESNLIVPLKVFNGDRNFSSEFAEAIEYALTNDIPICSTSVQTAGNQSSCPSTLCSELESYCDAGYMIACATGNMGHDSAVIHPATSYYTIGVGGYDSSCSDGYEEERFYRSGRIRGSNHGSISYYGSDPNLPYCSWCSDVAGQSAFKPDVYSCYRYNTDAGNRWNGTSAATPVVAAGGAIHHSVYGATYYGTHRDKYHTMNAHDVCPSEASQLGGVLHVPDLT